MPYEVRGKCVYKKDTGKKVGCTKGSVKKYLAALHMHANESIDHETLKQIIKEEFKASDISFSSTGRSATARLPLGQTTVSPTVGLAKQPLKGLNIKHEILPNLIAEFDPIRQKLGLNWKDVLRGWDWEANVQGENVQNPKLAWKFALGKRFEDLGNIRLGVEYTGGYGGSPEHRFLGSAGVSFE